MNNIIKYLLIFSIAILFIDIIYYNFFKDFIILSIPTPEGKDYYIKLRGYEILEITINGLLSENFNISNNSEKIDIYAEKINKLIEENKEYYNFYYSIFQKIYPERYFIFCTENSCGYYFFSITGLVRTNITNGDFLIIYIKEDFLNKMIKDIENRDPEILNTFKEGLKKGYIKIKNFNKIYDRIIKEYKKS